MAYMTKSILLVPTHHILQNALKVKTLLYKCHAQVATAQRTSGVLVTDVLFSASQPLIHGRFSNLCSHLTSTCDKGVESSTKPLQLQMANVWLQETQRTYSPPQTTKPPMVSK